MSTGALKGDQSLQMPSDSILESVIFQNFLGCMPPDPPSGGMLCMPMCFTHYDSACISQLAPHEHDDKSGCAPPFHKSRSAPELAIYGNTNVTSKVNLTS